MLHPASHLSCSVVFFRVLFLFSGVSFLAANNNRPPGFILLFLGAEVVAWARQASCTSELGEVGITWNTMIPEKTTTQMQLGIFSSWLWHQAEDFRGELLSKPYMLADDMADKYRSLFDALLSYVSEKNDESVICLLISQFKTQQGQWKATGHQVDVYDDNSTDAPMIGYWSNLDLFFGAMQRLGNSGVSRSLL